LQADYDVEVEWRPFELHPEIPPEGLELPAYVRANFGAAQQRLKEMAREAGLEIVLRDKMISSRRALEASEYAREQGKHEAFHRLVFRKFYGEGQDLRSWSVLGAAAEEAGLDPDEMQQETESGKYKAVVDAEIARAHAMGITGVPAYIFNDKYAVIGAQPYQVFQRAMAQVTAEANDE
jgi:predicted DsbA family dithiol-disulfide isomerase